MYIYPDNLSAKATLWLWELRDIGIIGVGLLLSVLALTQTGIALPLRYNNDKRKKPLFSRGSRVCRHLFNSFSKLKSDEKNIKKRRLFH